ncbi:unnamed protein product [Phytophthora lilii]|uniref:Unnamed protein product n=1 Tax=Phytophthora lilii TaxID=2077276 RepID=A0A9W6U267_9STRA|nr:unnamed protein product [Phytophthora lilii]
MTTTGDGSPSYTATQVDNCAFAAWYPQLKRVSIRGEVVPLPAEFVALLLADGVTLPAAPVASGIEEEDDEEDDEAASALTDEQLSVITTVREQVEKVLEDFGGKLFPKTNWSAPRDAAWMLGSLKCTSFEDVFLLLQASDFVVHDLTQPYIGCSEETEKTPSGHYLVLKKWCNFLDSMLFRCFVVGHRLVAVSQRNCDEFYEFLPDQQDDLCELLFNFYKTNFRKPEGEFGFPDPNYSFDVYIDKRRRVYLLDINVFGAATDTLLFSWEELLELQTGSPATAQDTEDADHVVDFRVVESKKGIRSNPLSGYRAPTDLVDHLAGGAGFDAFIEQIKRDNAAGASDSDSSDVEN